ncbi:MAG: LytR/AlgR family response regulator transcription factor [Acidobacteriota bacterium]
MKIRAVTVDDEPLACKRLKRLLSKHSDVELVGEAEDGEEAVEVVMEERPDLVFLDVRMPNRDGLEAFRELQERLPDSVRPLAVFTTAYEEHAVDAFAVEGVDYLVKPLDEEQLARALRRVRERLWRRTPEREDEEAGPNGEATSGHVAGHRANKIVNILLEDIGCVTVDDTITWAHTPQGKYRLKLTLQEAEERLPSPPFVRVSRSAVLNLDWVDHLSPMFSGTYTAVLRPAIGLEVHVSRRRARKLRELLGW